VAPAPTADAQIDEIVQRLEGRYSRQQISHSDLESRVRGSYHQFDAARIRTFVPVFVERGVRRSSVARRDTRRRPLIGYRPTLEIMALHGGFAAAVGAEESGLSAPVATVKFRSSTALAGPYRFW
jgi:hypothetical protein